MRKLGDGKEGSLGLPVLLFAVKMHLIGTSHGVWAELGRGIGGLLGVEAS